MTAVLYWTMTNERTIGMTEWLFVSQKVVLFMCGSWIMQHLALQGYNGQWLQWSILLFIIVYIIHWSAWWRTHYLLL